ncbi:iron-containing alcohol dehydrogenase [Paludibacterium yongneupense]|uniref:iron-containing alcohol dehydrogenase n=1 Tax=Paludibacterium yongneupense TaxID=400061 RepID=UPI00040CEC1B|nr:iron-containing alcohol dehydrogenase [Paludibacterium yongneupense]
MLDFAFYNPTRIFLGRGKIALLGQKIPADARVLVLYGGGSAERNGVLDEVRAALGERRVGEFGGIEPNPVYETLLQAVERVREHGADFLLAVGGGSIIDGCKFVAVAARYAGDPWEILSGRGQTIRSALPFATVLTLPATGSEMNSGAVVTRRSMQAKLSFKSEWVFPQFSILDPEKTFSLPPRQVANGIVDTFVHVLEQYLTYPVGATVQDRLAEALLLTLVEAGPRALAEPADYDVRANLMWCASLALNGLLACGVPRDWATHMLGHELTALHGIDHARTLAVVLPAMLRVRREEKRAKLLQYGARIWGCTEGDEDRRIEEAIARTEAFFTALGLPTRLGAYRIGAEHIDALIGQLTAHEMVALGEHGTVTPEMSRQVFLSAL